MAAQAAIANRLADYFVICGLDASSGLEPDRLSGALLRHNFVYLLVLRCKIADSV